MRKSRIAEEQTIVYPPFLPRSFTLRWSSA